MKTISIIGDIHGNFEYVIKKIKRLKITDTIFIFIGDVGLGFHSDKYYDFTFGHWNENLKKNNNEVYFMRGNHDNPHIWFNNELNYSHIKLVQDYDVLTFNNENYLCVGGAISVDRTGREEGKTYWKEEVLVYDESKVKDLTGIDYVLTHSAPDFCEKRGYDSPSNRS